MAGMFELLAQRPWFRRLWAAGAISLVGDWLGFVAISRLAMDRGGGPVALAIVFAAHTLPHAWAMPITGVVADRFDRRRLLVAVPLVQALLTLFMALAASHGALVPLQALVVVRTTFGAFMAPAEAAALRHTVEPSELVRANALLSGTWSFAYVAGMALGGAIAGLGPTLALVLDSATFVLAAMFALGLPTMQPDDDARPKTTGLFAFVKAIPHDLKTAFDHARVRPALFRAMLGKVPVAIAGGAGWMILNLVADRAKPLGTAAVSLGILQAVRGAGTGIGPMSITLFTRGAAPSRLVERAAVLLSFASIVAFSFAANTPAILVLVTLTWGMGTGSNWVLTSSSLQRLSPNGMIGRLSSIDELWTTAVIVLGAVAAALLLEAGVSMPVVAITGTAVGILVLVWLDQLGAGAKNEIDSAVDSDKSNAG